MSAASFVGFTLISGFPRVIQVILAMPGIALLVGLGLFGLAIYALLIAGSFLVAVGSLSIGSVLWLFRWTRPVAPIFGGILFGLAAGIFVGAWFNPHLITRFLPPQPMPLLYPIEWLLSVCLGGFTGLTLGVLGALCVWGVMLILALRPRRQPAVMA